MDIQWKVLWVVFFIVFVTLWHGFQVIFPEVNWFPLRKGEVGIKGAIDQRTAFVPNLRHAESEIK